MNNFSRRYVSIHTETNRVCFENKKSARQPPAHSMLGHVVDLGRMSSDSFFCSIFLSFLRKNFKIGLSSQNVKEFSYEYRLVSSSPWTLFVTGVFGHITPRDVLKSAYLKTNSIYLVSRHEDNRYLGVYSRKSTFCFYIQSAVVRPSLRRWSHPTRSYSSSSKVSRSKGSKSKWPHTGSGRFPLLQSSVGFKLQFARYTVHGTKLMKHTQSIHRLRSIIIDDDLTPTENVLMFTHSHQVSHGILFGIFTIIPAPKVADRGRLCCFAINFRLLHKFIHIIV
jgi:hypothetical protein